MTRQQPVILSLHHALSCPAVAAANTFNVGGTATIYIQVDASSLSSVFGGGTSSSTTVAGVTINNNDNSWVNYVTISPADASPPTSAPGITITGSVTYTYNVVIRKLLICTSSRSVRSCCKGLLYPTVP